MRLGTTAAPRPVAVICMPMVLAACCSPTRALVPEIMAGKMGAMDTPMMATASTLASSKGFHTSRTAPRSAPATPPSTSLLTPT